MSRIHVCYRQILLWIHPWQPPAFNNGLIPREGFLSLNDLPTVVCCRQVLRFFHAFLCRQVWRLFMATGLMTPYGVYVIVECRGYEVEGRGSQVEGRKIR